MYDITARKRSCGKVIFLHLSVILFTGGGSLSGGLCQRGSLSRGALCLGGLSPGRSLTKGVSVQGGSLSGEVSVGGRGLTLYGKERAVHILLECVLILSCTKLADRARHLEYSVV